MMPESFHFIRPIWLLAAGFVPLFFLWARRRGQTAGAWSRVCDPALLPHLLVGENGRVRHWPTAALAIGWLAACVALAGPTWEKFPQAAYSEPADTVAVLSLSPSMQSRDVAPSRLERAQFELHDLLEQAEGTVGLVIFSEEAYAVTPLTDDSRVITETIPILSPQLMPGRGARLDRGIDEAVRLLDNAQTGDGRIVLLVDEAGQQPEATLTAAERAAEAGYPVSVIALTETDARLQDVARAGNGAWTPLRPDDSDITQVLAAGRGLPGNLGDLRPHSAEADVWRDVGAWLVLIPLALAPLAFRRGWVGALLVFVVFSSGGTPAQASVTDWFRTADQQGANAFESGDHAEAAERFENPEWQSAALYREGDYAGAIDALQGVDSPRAQYNLGNALARSGQLEDAVAAYDQALALKADDPDTQYNRDLVQKLLDEQQNQEQQQSPQQQGQQAEDSSSESQQSGSESQSDASAQDASEGSKSESGTEDSSESSSEGSSDDSGETSGSETASAKENKEPGNDPSSEPSETEHLDSDSETNSEAGSEAEGREPEPSAGEPAGASDQEKAMAQNETTDTSNAMGSKPDPQREAEEANQDTRQDVAEAFNPESTSQNSDPDANAAVAAAPPVQPMTERDQELEHRLSQVPDDPGGLLAEKLRRRYAQKKGYMPMTRGVRR